MGTTTTTTRGDISKFPHREARHESGRPFFVITPCSASKNRDAEVIASALERAPQDAVADQWQRIVTATSNRVAAADLYQGRAFTIAREVAAKTGADFGIVSAGLGFVLGNTDVPSYDLTISSRHENSVARRITDKFCPSNWWKSVSQGPFSSKLIDECRGRRLALFCLSRSYAAMLADDLLTLVDSASCEIRILGLSLGRHLPPKLQGFALQYDERLSVVGRTGTRVDFAARALADYTEHVLPATGIDLREEQAFVARRLSGTARHAMPKRRRVTDTTLLALIRQLTPTVGSESGRMLAYIRDNEGLACEQKRFAKLFKVASKG